MIECNEKEERLIPLADIPLFCRLTPARVGVEVVSGAAQLGGPAGAETERRIPDLHVVLTTLVLLVDVVTNAFAIVRLVALLIVAVLKTKRRGMNHRRKRMSTLRRTHTNTVKFCWSLALTHFASVRARFAQGSDNCSNQRN